MARDYLTFLEPPNACPSPSLFQAAHHEEFTAGSTFLPCAGSSPRATECLQPLPAQDQLSRPFIGSELVQGCQCDPETNPLGLRACTAPQDSGVAGERLPRSSPVVPERPIAQRPPHIEPCRALSVHERLVLWISFLGAFPRHTQSCHP